MNVEIELRSAQKELDVLLSQKSMSATQKKQADILLSKVSQLRDHQLRQERVASLAKEVGLPVNEDEQRAEKYEAAFRKYLRGNVEEIRSYAALTTAGVAIPQDFYSAYVEKLKSFSGIRQVANIITTSTGHTLKNPFADDTANSGERLNENDPVSLANPTFSATTFGAYRYASKGLKYSAQLLQDAGIDLTAYLSKILARRIGVLTNSEFTNGGSGAMTGVIPSITSVNTSASPTAVTVGEIVDLQNIDEALLSGAVYMFSPGVERALRKMTGTDGLPVFPEMRTGRVLCGYNYVLNVDMPSALTATAKAIAFGNFGHAVTIREVTPQLLVSRERFAEQKMLYTSLRHDMDCAVVDASALTVLAQHA